MATAGVLSRVIFAIAWLLIPSSAMAQTLAQALRNGGAPVARFSHRELASPIAGSAWSASPAAFLLAYFDVTKRGAMGSTLHVLRFDRGDGSLVRSAFVRGPGLRAQFERSSSSIDCLGPAQHVAERSGRIFLETHLSPSAGCVVILTSHLRVVTALSGWVLGYVGDRYAVIRESERRFGSTRPQLAVSVYDSVVNHATPVYPVAGDRHVRGAGLSAPIVTNGNDVAFSLATISAGPAPTKTDYVFALFNDRWESRAFAGNRVSRMYHVRNIGDFVRAEPRSAF